jgi:hypothetical protein
MLTIDNIMTAVTTKSNKACMPNFLIIGAMKSGTTSLHNYLNQHPDVFMSPRKEPHFFAFENYPLQKYRESMELSLRQSREILGQDRLTYELPVTLLDDYVKLFKKAASETAIGESSTTYLYLSRSIERIKYYIPQAKLIGILRNPVDRAYSNFIFFRRNNREPIPDFDTALQAEDRRIREGWASGYFYRRRGFYFEQLKPYYQQFSRSQIRVYLFDDLCSDPMGVLRDIFRFLGVDETFVPDTTKKYNPSNGVVLQPKWRPINHLFNRPNSFKSLAKRILPDMLFHSIKLILTKRQIAGATLLQFPPLSIETRKQLQNDYKNDIIKLQDLIGRDLSHWLSW